MHCNSIPFLFILFYYESISVECKVSKDQSNITISETDHSERIVQGATGMKLKDIIKFAPDNDNERTEIDQNIVIIHKPDTDNLYQRLQEFIFDDKSNNESCLPIIPSEIEQKADKILEKNAFDGYLTCETTLYFVVVIVLLMHIYNSSSSEE